MKKLILIITVLILTKCLFSQFYGKWVIPTKINESASSTFLLSFNKDLIDYETLQNQLPYGEKRITAGAYNEDYELEFYILDYLVCYNGTCDEWNNYAQGGSNEFYPECQMIRITQNKYRFLYTIPEYTDLGDGHFKYTDFIIENDQLNWDNWGYDILGGIAPGKMVAFGITDSYNDVTYLYASTPKANAMSGYIKAGIKKWTITENDIDNMEIIINSDHQLFSADDFNSYNLELKSIDEDDVVIAWISADEQSSDKIFIYNDQGPEKIIDLNLGRIAGIEFSTYDDDVIYASCTNAGIVAVNYDTEQITEYMTNDEYNSTFLQTAPDGHIYGFGISDSPNYTKLGRINMGNGVFEDDQFTFLEEFQSVGTYKIFEDNTYYTLPENDEKFPFQLSVDITDVSCPGGNDGQATVSVICGEEPYTYTWYMKIDDEWNLMEGYNEATATELYEGTYKCVVEDATGKINEIIFTIEVYYTIKDFIEVSENDV